VLSLTFAHSTRAIEPAAPLYAATAIVLALLTLLPQAFLPQ